MKLSIAMAVGALSLATASPVEKRQAPVTEFSVSNFAANCLATGGCSWSFNLVEVPDTAVKTCSGSVPSGNTFPNLPPSFNCVGDTQINWRVSKNGPLPSYRLVINDLHQFPSRGGSTNLPESDFPIVTDATGTHQTYTGPTSFTFPVVGA